MCRKMFYFIWGMWWFHRSKDFEAMKAGKLSIRPWLICQYNENTLMDFPSSVFPCDKLFNNLTTFLYWIQELMLNHFQYTIGNCYPAVTKRAWYFQVKLHTEKGSFTQNIFIRKCLSFFFLLYICLNRFILFLYLCWHL